MCLMLYNMFYLMGKGPEKHELEVRDHIERNWKGDRAEECESLCLSVHARREDDDKSCGDRKAWCWGGGEQLGIICYR